MLETDEIRLFPLQDNLPYLFSSTFVGIGINQSFGQPQWKNFSVYLFTFDIITLGVSLLPLVILFLILTATPGFPAIGHHHVAPALPRDHDGHINDTHYGTNDEKYSYPGVCQPIMLAEPGCKCKLNHTVFMRRVQRLYYFPRMSMSDLAVPNTLPLGVVVAVTSSRVAVAKSSGFKHLEGHAMRLPKKVLYPLRRQQLCLGSTF